ncbi:prenylcysteine oxidase [Orussus abietinus]|uniref:prenylcysteine oxidase n=1 Tax=Orussus abietinus TaxID=222816 RepID=UPI0006260391|nr:prenylcysteine oxidase [Orussus abietinus]
MNVVLSILHNAPICKSRTMRIGFEFLFIGLLIVRKTFCTEPCKPKIAIVGAGIGGASASHFLTELFVKHLEIDIYEVDKIGGRLATIAVGKNEYEAGGSIIHSRNRYMNDFLQLLGMERRPFMENQRFGIWNGDAFVFEESNSEIISLLKLFYRYGFDPLRLQRHVNSVLENFENIYELQDHGKAFENVTGLMFAINKDFPEMLQVSTKQYLLNLGFSSKLIDELVETTIVVNYGQNTDIHGFVGCVSVAGAGANLWAVKGGNKEIPEHLIYRNGKINLIPSQVKKIRCISQQNVSVQYEIIYGNGTLMSNFYDIVIIATPLTYDQKYPISFEGFPEQFKFKGDYQVTMATFVEGNTNPQHFGLEESLDGILSCNPNKTIINSISRLFPVQGSAENISRVWKIFSKEVLKSHLLNDMFLQVNQVKEVRWKAYPRYSTNIRHDKFKLHDFLYHVNAIEWVASAMEMSAIGGRNVANLAFNDYRKKCLLSKQNDFDRSIPQTTCSSEL